jgi:hypothetical protein
MGEVLTMRLRILDVVSTPSEAREQSKGGWIRMTECAMMNWAVLVELVPQVCRNKRERLCADRRCMVSISLKGAVPRC